MQGNRYEGEWRDGKMDGWGKLYWADGDVDEGTFRAGEFIAEPPTGTLRTGPAVKGLAGNLKSLAGKLAEQPGS